MACFKLEVKSFCICLLDQGYARSHAACGVEGPFSATFVPQVGSQAQASWASADVLSHFQEEPVVPKEMRQVMLSEQNNLFHCPQKPDRQRMHANWLGRMSILNSYAWTMPNLMGNMLLLVQLQIILLEQCATSVLPVVSGGIPCNEAAQPRKRARANSCQISR